MLDDFLAECAACTLDLKDRERIVDQALLLVEQLYVHLPLKRAMHAVDPVQRLKLLRRRLATLDELQVSREMLTIFAELRDLHTNYLLPEPYLGRTALLPFLIEEFFENGTRRYMVSHVATGFRHTWFKPGVVITHWNGLPIDRAVALNADQQMGSNADARHARGLEAMTIRPLMLTVPPEEAWVIVRYIAKGEAHDVQFRWRVIEPPPSPTGVDPNTSASRAAFGLGYDALTEMARRVKKALFAPQALQAEQRMAALGGAVPDPSDKAAARDLKKNSLMPDVFSFRTVETAYGKFGYIRIWTFMVDDAEAFVDEFIRISELLPPDGLILDVRANGGGLITAGEQLLQVLTPRPVDPCRLHFINTPLTLALTEKLDWLARWQDSIAQAVETGAVYSYGFPLEPPETYNTVGQKYFGPVVLVTDALCYSTTDIFAAGFQDHGVGLILGTQGNLGAGGANVWTHELLRELLPGTLKELPRGASFRVAVRRTTRVGEHSGVPVEGLGVLPDEIHRMTANDLLNQNADLIDDAARLLSQRPVRVLEARVLGEASAGDAATARVKLAVNTRNITRLDVWSGGRPQASLDVTDGRTTVTVALDRAHPCVELRGYEAGELVAARRLELEQD